MLFRHILPAALVCSRSLIPAGDLGEPHRPVKIVVIQAEVIRPEALLAAAATFRPRVADSGPWWQAKGGRKVQWHLHS